MNYFLITLPCEINGKMQINYFLFCLWCLLLLFYFGKFDCNEQLPQNPYFVRQDNFRLIWEILRSKLIKFKHMFDAEKGRSEGKMK